MRPMIVGLMLLALGAAAEQAPRSALAAEPPPLVRTAYPLHVKLSGAAAPADPATRRDFLQTIDRLPDRLAAELPDLGLDRRVPALTVTTERPPLRQGAAVVFSWKSFDCYRGGREVVVHLRHTAAASQADLAAAVYAGVLVAKLPAAPPWLLIGLAEYLATERDRSSRPPTSRRRDCLRLSLAGVPPMSRLRAIGITDRLPSSEAAIAADSWAWIEFAMQHSCLSQAVLRSQLSMYARGVENVSLEHALHRVYPDLESRIAGHYSLGRLLAD